MTINIFEWEVEDSDSDPIHVKAGHLMIKVEELNDDDYCDVIGTSIRWEDNNLKFEMEECFDALKIVKYIAIGINAEIESQSVEVQSDYIKSFNRYVLILLSLVVAVLLILGFLIKLLN